MAAHTWEVLSRLRDLARLRPWLPELCGFPGLWNVLFWSALIHDWGKAAAGFQAALRSQGKWPHRHEVLSVVFLDWIAEALPRMESLGAAAAILSHHRDAGELSRLYPLDLPPEDDPIVGLLREIDPATVHGLWRWLAEAVPHWMVDLGFDELGVRRLVPPDMHSATVQVTERGRERIRDWLRRYQRLVRSIRDAEIPALGPFVCIFLRGGILQADHIGSAHLGALPLLTLSVEAILGAAGVQTESLYDHQRESAAMIGNALLTAPTGSGKTEAALLWAVAQDCPGRRLPRLFYTLPYQASMNAMYDRLNNSFPDRVGLVHGRSVLALYQRFMEQPYTPEEAARQARLARGMADLHYHPIRVFSPYEMLKAVYQLKGYEAMLTDFAGGAFVFDEIHAYEPKRLAMILETVRYLRERFGARFFVMSATLPSLVRDRLADALGSPVSVTASASLFHAFARHRLHRVPGDLLSEEGLARVRNSFQQGKSVLVTCNTVKRAQDCHRCLAAWLPEDSLILIHGRFNGRDRLEMERQVLDATGLRSASRRPVVVVATQVVEVSLNIDLDVLFSDPAPLEALIQRFGRVNRGRRPSLAPVNVFTEPEDGQGVYIPGLVSAALEMLSARDGHPVDEGSVQGWLDAIYSGEIARAWSKEYDEAAAEFRRAFLDNLRPFHSGAELEDAFERLFDGTEVLPGCLQSEYLAMQEQRPIEASQLLVPVSWRRWQGMKRAGRVLSSPGQWPRVVDVPYSSKLGLGDWSETEAVV